MIIHEFLISAIICVFLVISTTLIYYEVLRITWGILPKLTLAPRLRVVVVVIAIFLGHTIAVWVYGMAYWILAEYFGFGSLRGEIMYFEHSFFNYVYFSAATYSSLGLGDVFPVGGLKIITGVEVLNGLVLIGWSVSFTYLVMEKWWDMHKR